LLNLDVLFFYSFALLTIGGAIATVTLRNAVHSALALTVSLMGVAGLYLLEHAEFLFAVQIILYIGGVVVLFLFVIMLVNLDEAQRQRQFSRHWWIGLAGIILAFGLSGVLMSRKPGAWPWGGALQSAPASTGNTEAIADVLFSEYLLPFEIASVLLLVAVVGSVFMAKKRA
jgi:NADH-quinone oxidoreductase subunit J